MPPRPTVPNAEALLSEARWLRAVAGGLIGDGAAADDLAQDVLVQALNQPSIPQGSGLRAWLRTIARRRAGRLRSRGRVASDAEWQAARPESGPSTDGLSSHDRLVLHGELARAIDALPPADRDLIVWRYFDDRSSDWIAKELGVSSAAARQRVSRALARLRANLATTERGASGWSLALVALSRPPLGTTIPAPDSDGGPAGTPASPPASLALPVVLSVMTATKLAAAAVVVLAAIWAITAWNQGTAPTAGTTPGTAHQQRPENIDPALALTVPDADSIEPRRALAAPLTRADDEVEIPPPVAAPYLRVVDATGAPVPHAKAGWIDGDVRARALSVDALGIAELPSGQPFELLVSHRDHVAEHRVIAPLAEGDVVSVELAPASVIEGHVLVDGLAPPPSLSFLGLVTNESIGLTDQTQAAAQPLRDLGVFPEWPRIRPESDGAFRCRVAHSAESVTFFISPAFEPNSATIRGEPQPVRHGRITLPVGARGVEINLASRPALTGRFIWAGTDQAIEGNFMYAVMDDEGYGVGGSASEELMRDGRFWVGVDRRENSDDETEPWQRGTKVSLSVFHPEAQGDFQHVVELESLSFPHDLGAIEVPRLTRRRVRVLGRTARGHEPVVAALVANDGRAKTDADGEVDLMVREDDHVDVFAPGYGFVRKRLSDLTPEDGGLLQVVLEPAPTLRVHVGELEPSTGGRSTPRVRLRFDGESPFGLGGSADERPEYHYFHHRQFFPRGRGSIVLVQLRSHLVDYYVPETEDLVVHGLRPGTSFRLELCDGLDQVLASTPVAMGEGEQTAVLEPGATGSLTCKVTDADGRNVPGARLKVKSAGSRTLHLGASDGEVAIGPLAPGSYSLTASAKGGREASLTAVEIGPGANEVALVFE